MQQRITTRKEELAEELHGITVKDPYRWLEGDPDSPELRAWLNAQAERASDYFKNIPVRDEIRDQLKRLFERDSVCQPTPREGRYFYEKRKADEDLAILYVKEGLGGTPKVLINPNTLSSDKTAVLTDWEPTRDGKRLMYELSYSGNDKSELRVMDVDSGKDLEEIIPDDIYPEMDAWNVDGTGFWYSRRDPNAPISEAKLNRRIFFHRIGTPVAEDELVWGTELAKENIVWVRLSDDGRFLMGGIYGQEDGKEWYEIHLRDLTNDKGFVPVVTRTPGSVFSGKMHRDTLYVLTNHEAPNWKLMATKLEDAIAGTPKFKDVIPEGNDIIEEYEIVGDRLFVTFLHNVHTVMKEYSLDGKLVRDIGLPTIGKAGGFTSEPEGEELFYGFNSFVYPPTIYRLDLSTNATETLEQLKVTFDTEQFMTEQVWYPSKDGTKIPMFLVHRKDLKRVGNAPTLLYGYGGFDVSLRPSFVTNIVPFIERGGIYALANLRGGGEFGKEWHDAGRRKNKQNVFDDFIAAAEFLIREKYTDSNHLAINGGSNGGLLVAATMVQRPDLVRAVVCQVPVADMIRYHLHNGGVHWIPDYGNPDDPDMLPYLLEYSPYHNLKDGEKYPATLIATSDGDDRVHPSHAYKFAARLEEANASGNPILMRVELKAGHSGAYAISRMVEEDADIWAFIFDQLGMIQS